MLGRLGNLIYWVACAVALLCLIGVATSAYRYAATPATASRIYSDTRVTEVDAETLAKWGVDVRAFSADAKKAADAAEEKGNATGVGLFFLVASVAIFLTGRAARYVLAGA